MGKCVYRKKNKKNNKEVLEKEANHVERNKREVCEPPKPKQLTNYIGSLCSAMRWLRYGGVGGCSIICSWTPGRKKSKKINRSSSSTESLFSSSTESLLLFEIGIVLGSFYI